VLPTILKNFLLLGQKIFGAGKKIAILKGTQA
jgi:hypothetical protein